MNNNTLSNRYNQKSNSFSIVEFVLAILVMYYHSYHLYFGQYTEKKDIFSKLTGVTLGEILVACFFTISGFMIITSLNKSPNIINYLKRRLIRIFPPLIFCVLVSALIIAPIISSRPFFGFLRQPNLYVKYILDNILLWNNTNYVIADVFSNNPCHYVINSSLWTIKHQFFLYIFIIFINFLILKKWKKGYKYFYFLLFLITYNSLDGRYNEFFYSLGRQYSNIGIMVESQLLLRLTFYFCTGVFYKVYMDRINIRRKAFALGILILILCSSNGLFFRRASMVVLPYLIIYIGTMKSKIKCINLSYQIYLWAFPIQQIIIYMLNGRINYYIYMLISIVITVIISIIAYYITEWPLYRKKINNMTC